MKKLILLLFINGAIGCASAPQRIVGPNGQEQAIIQCYNNIANCYAQSVKFCRGNYDLKDTNQQIMITPTKYGPVSDTLFIMRIACKDKVSLLK